MAHGSVFHIGVLDAHPFGLFVAIGIVVGYAVALWQTLAARLSPRYLPGLLIVVVLGSFITARIGYVAQHPAEARNGLQGVLSIWHGGFSLVGGVVGGVVLLALYTWAHREPFWRWADALAPAASIGLAIGMLGLPYGGEGWGQPTRGPFFMRVAPELRPAAFIDDTRFQPIFAYEAVLFGALALVLVALTWRQRRVGRPLPGAASLTFLFVAMAGYAALRPLTLDASATRLVLQTQAVCAVVAAVALGGLVTRLWRSHRANQITREIARVTSRSD